MWIHIPSGHDRTWTKPGSYRNILQQSHICVTKPTNWFQEIFLLPIDGNNCSTGQLLPRLLWVRLTADSPLPLPSIFARLALTVSFSNRFCSSSSRAINFSCSKYEPRSLAANTSAQSLSNEFEPFFLFGGFLSLAKGQGLLRFFLGRHGIDISF